MSKPAFVQLLQFWSAKAYVPKDGLSFPGLKRAVIDRYMDAGIALQTNHELVRRGVHDTARALDDGHILVLHTYYLPCGHLAGVTSSLFDKDGTLLTSSRESQDE